jgi:hypothetical protein
MSHDTFERTLMNLKILGSIREQDRLCSSNNSLDVSRPSKWSCLYRFYYGESRKQNIDCVRDILTTAFMLAESYLNKETLKWRGGTGTEPHTDITHRLLIEQTVIHQRLNRLVSSLEDACKGIQNWAQTYANDVKTVHCIQTMMSNLTDNIHQIHLAKTLLMPVSVSGSGSLTGTGAGGCSDACCRPQQAPASNNRSGSGSRIELAP